MEEEMERNDIPAEAEKGDPAWYHDINLEHAEKFISENLKAAARNVIAIGYYLKYIRDNKLYEEAGYQNIWDYAREKYGFSISTASRYMSRNDKFSKGGNSPIMDERYREYGKSQLQEMLSLDAEQMDQVTPDMTAREIRRLRRSKESDFVEGPADSPEPEKDESVATSQKQEEKPENQKYDGCPDGITCCPRNEWGTTPEEQEDGRKECRKCWEQYEKRQSILGGSRGQQDVPEEEEQPELPILKNNEKRGEFIDSYTSWPIWIDRKETGERYYRYRLPEADIVIKVYFHRCFDFNSTAKEWKDRYHDGWGAAEYYLMQAGQHFKDCKTNKSALIEYLKELQKGEN